MDHSHSLLYFRHFEEYRCLVDNRSNNFQEICFGHLYCCTSINIPFFYYRGRMNYMGSYQTCLPWHNCCWQSCYCKCSLCFREDLLSFLRHRTMTPLKISYWKTILLSKGSLICFPLTDSTFSTRKLMLHSIFTSYQLFNFCFGNRQWIICFHFFRYNLFSLESD